LVPQAALLSDVKVPPHTRVSAERQRRRQSGACGSRRPRD